MTPNDEDRTSGDAKARRIAALVEDVRAARAAGKDVDHQTVIRAYPDLMPELAEELAKLRRIEAARAAAEVTVAKNDATSDSRAEMLNPETSADEPRTKIMIQAAGYSILREINRGGQAVVYLAMQRNTGRKVALKVMRDGPLADERSLARFKREVGVLAAINHPNIVTIFDTGQTTDGSWYMAMDYIGGRSLDEYVKERQKKHEQDPSRLLRLFLRICAAVSAAHLRGVVHRDLKPSNILIDDRGEPHILDFGLARTALDTIAQNGNAPISITGEFLGSLPWSSPEQAEGDPDKIDIRTDVYSLGVILYQMITGGHFPYQVVGNIRDVLNNILTAEPTPPSKLMLASKDRRTVSPRLPLVNEAIEKIVLKALAKKREKRYQSAGELGREIANYLSGLPTRPREGSGEKPSVSANVEPRRVKPLLVVAASVAFVIVSAALTVWFPRRPSKPANVIASTKTASLISPRISVVSSETKTPNSVTLIKPKPTKVTPAPVAEIKPDTAPAVPVVPPPDAKVFRHHHFKVFAEAVGWYDAARECAAMGGHLAKVDDSDQLTFLQKLKGTDTISWVGGSADLHGNWTWSDGAAIALDRISTDPQHPEFRWLFLSSNGKLLTRPQNGRIDSAQFPVVEGFVCEWDQ